MLKQIVTYYFVFALAVMASVGAVSPAQAMEYTDIKIGDLVKGSNSSLYYIGPNGSRYIFPKDTVFFSWFSDFSKVKTVPQEEIIKLAIGGNMGVRPGARLVQFVTEDTNGRIVVSDPAVYAVSDNPNDSRNVLHKIKDPAQAVRFFGAAWEKKIVPVLETLYNDYIISDELKDGQTLRIISNINEDFATDINIPKVGL